MPVKTIAVDPITATRDTEIRELARTMRDEEIGDVIIVEGEKPVGIVTDRDIALALADNEDVSGLSAGDIMTEDPVTITEDAEAVDLPKQMAEAQVRRIPVVADDGTLTGIATLDDVVATVGEELEDVATVIESQSPGYSPD